ncbi:hypothetical protein NQ176_g5411 [Zarea fungicola]|uniref:Uncharacterized protein n=1 Tax=Zarea fungicola TaxID=93591 RepID=A0ACC1N8K9_9HYPO|nr:hypothetical protein NQ176_g5411 [Lecanicillium fungicola]
MQTGIVMRTPQWNSQSASFCSRWLHDQDVVAADRHLAQDPVWNGDLDACALTDRDKTTLREFWTKLDNDSMEYCSRCRKCWFQKEMDYDDVCSRCYRKDKKRGPGEPFFFSAENQLDFGPVPSRLPELTPKEEALIARVHVHVNIMLVRGQRYKYRGHVVHFLREVGLEIWVKVKEVDGFKTRLSMAEVDQQTGDDQQQQQQRRQYLSGMTGGALERAVMYSRMNSDAILSRDSKAVTYCEEQLVSPARSVNTAHPMQSGVPEATGAIEVPTG